MFLIERCTFQTDNGAFTKKRPHFAIVVLKTAAKFCITRLPLVKYKPKDACCKLKRNKNNIIDTDIKTKSQVWGSY